MREGKYSIASWDKYQHYKDRNPPWIKLHVRLLNDKAFMALADASKGLLMLLWVLASEDNGCFPEDLGDVAFRLRRECLTRKDLKPLVDSGFIIPPKEQTLARASNCSSETETEAETETEKRQRGASRFAPPTIEEVSSYITTQGYTVDAERWHAYYTSNGWKVGKNPMKDWQAAVRTWAKGNGTTKTEAPLPNDGRRILNGKNPYAAEEAYFAKLAAEGRES